MNTRKVAGWKAKREGKNWEGFFESSCDLQGVTCIRIPDGCRTLGKFKLVRVKSPFDFVIGYGDKIACIDLKSFGTGNTITYSQIDQNQVKSLYSIYKHGTAGYIVYHREPDKVVFYDAHSLISVMPKGGLHWESGTVLGNMMSLNIKLLFF